jgi:hypothetical protein
LIRIVTRRTQFVLAVFVFLTVVQSNGAGSAPLKAPLGNAEQPCSLSGDWSLTTIEGVRTNTSTFKMACRNDQLIGDGNDGKEVYSLRGSFQKPTGISFTKTYNQAMNMPGFKKQIDYYGKLNTSGARPKVEGIWKSEVRIGHFLTRNVVAVQGTWKAEMTRSHTYAFTDFSEH